MNLEEAGGAFLFEHRADGRLTSDASVRSYRRTLELHSEDCAGRGHVTLGESDRVDVLTTMARAWSRVARDDRRALRGIATDEETEQIRDAVSRDRGGRGDASRTTASYWQAPHA